MLIIYGTSQKNIYILSFMGEGEGGAHKSEISNNNAVRTADYTFYTEMSHYR